MSRGIGDIQYIGRQLFTLLVQLTLASLAAILAVALGYWLAILWTLNLLQYVFLIALILLIEAGLLVGLLALVFKRFDPSRADLS
jgi:hypothetical protein